MSGATGTCALTAAGAAALGTLAACIASRLGDDRKWLGRARWGLFGSMATLIVAAGALLAALVWSDLHLAYVAEHTERSLPLWLRLGAFWAGQEGSLLLWAVLLAGVGAATAFSRRHIVHRGEWVTLGIFAGLNLFFALLLMVAADPFRTLAAIPPDGRGLHPQLQHWAMVFHPPMLFMGYAVFAAPFAIACGALAAGRSDTSWVIQMRRPALLAWLCLGAGMALGAWWAYIELGWGGYWAWDPVENASLMPWLTGTALIHSIAVHQHRGVLRGWTVGLAAVTFGLCLFGTYITRSGVLESMHAFGRSTVGTWFLTLLIVMAAGVVGLVVWRRRLLGGGAPAGGWFGREGGALAGNVLLSAMAVVTLVGTVFPLISGLGAGASVTVAERFYNRLIVPLGLGTAALAALAPLLAYGVSGGAALGRRALGPGVGGLACVGIALASGMYHPAALACVAICTFAWLAIVIDFVRSVWSHSGYTGFGLVEAAGRIIDGNHRRYGGQVAHAGLLLVILGVTGSKLFGASTTAKVSEGQTLSVGGYTLRFDGVRRVRGDNYIAAEAALTLVSKGRGGVVLRPQQRLYDQGGEPATRASIRSSWRDDVYVAMVGWERGGTVAAIQARVNPLALWIWIGAATIAAGGVFGLLPRLLPPPRDVPIPPPRGRDRGLVVRRLPQEINR